MPNVVIDSRSIGVPDNLGVMGVPLDVQDFYRFSVALKGSPGDEVILYGSRTDPPGLENAYGLGVLEYGDIVHIEGKLQTRRIFAVRKGGRGSGSEIVISGPLFASADPSVQAGKQSYGFNEVPNDGNPGPWIDINDNTYDTLTFSSEGFNNQDGCAVEVSDPVLGGIATVATLTGPSQQVTVPANFKRFRVIRTAGVPSFAGLGLVGNPFGPVQGYNQGGAPGGQAVSMFATAKFRLSAVNQRLDGITAGVPFGFGFAAPTKGLGGFYKMPFPAQIPLADFDQYVVQADIYRSGPDSAPWKTVACSLYAEVPGQNISGVQVQVQLTNGANADAVSTDVYITVWRYTPPA